MKHFIFLILFLTNCYAVDYVVKTPYTNSNIGLQPSGIANAILPYKSNAPDNGNLNIGSSSYKFNDVISNKINGITHLDSNHLFTEDDFPTMANINTYAAHINGVSDFDGTAWSGGINLTEIGTLTQGTNHLGQTVYNTGDGNDGAYLSGVPTGQNTNFSAGGWFKIDDVSAYRYLVSKHSVTPSEQSFVLDITTDSYLYSQVSYNSSGGINYLPGPNIAPFINDGKFHFYGMSYKYISATEAYILLMLDDTVVGYTKLTTNTGRNDDGGANVAFGGSDTTGNLYGSMSDVFFIQGVNAWLTPNQWRKIYGAGSGATVTIDRNGEVKIGGRQKVRIKHQPENITAFTTTAYVTLSGWLLYHPEQGNYCVVADGSAVTIDGDSDSSSGITFSIFYNDVQKNKTGSSIGGEIMPAGFSLYGLYSLYDCYSASANSNVSLRAKISDSGDSSNIFCGTGLTLNKD